jgi:ATP-binding cassette, subfamily B, bacterial
MQIAQYAYPQLLGISVFFSLMLVEAALNVLKPWPLKLIVDYVLKGQPLPGRFLFSTSGRGGSPAWGCLRGCRQPL